MSIWLELTNEFNRGRVRAALSSGQAVVHYGLALMSKDGDWIIREDQETLDHILATLSRYNASYRFGAPLDLGWLRGGWSCHFEFERDGSRIRCDFVSRPPRLSTEDLQNLWTRVEAEGSEKVVSKAELAALKLTNREKDYVVIGELARGIEIEAEALRYSRDPQQIRALLSRNPGLLSVLKTVRPGIAGALGTPNEVEQLEEQLDKERRVHMRLNTRRIESYMAAAQNFQTEYVKLASQLGSLALLLQHQLLVDTAKRNLPYEVTF